LVVSARSGKRGALLFLDLDQFKSLNDTAGHDVGDLLLQEVATRLTSCIRESDTVSRLGGDEFLVLLEDLSQHEIEALTQTEVIGQKILNSISQPYQLDTYNHHCTASIGAILFDQHSSDVEEVIKKADIAMYQAKSGGRNALVFFDPKMQEAISSRMGMEQELRQALVQKQFELHYQIQVDGAFRPLGAEALIRWNHPRHEMISPLLFIQLAEQSGLILPIGQWVLETACAQLILWQQHPSSKNLVLSVNVSAKQFQQEKFVTEMQETVQRYGIDPTKLKLELTESMLVDDFANIVDKMNTLSKLGINFSLDDFGTGYSSLQYLKKLPLSQLKIDQSFVQEINFNPSDYAITRTIIAMAHSLDLSVIAEGVETKEQMQCLLDIDCNQCQLKHLMLYLGKAN
jgi:diguanylate cyclase (GGDEF)-like protein